MSGQYRVWKGSYFDGRVARRHPVSVALTGAGIAIGFPESAEVRVWPYSDVRLTEAGIGEGARLERGAESPEVLVVDGSDVDGRDFLTALKRHAPGLHAVPTGPSPSGSRLGLVVGVAVALVAGLIFFYFRVVPALAERVAESVPIAWEDQLGATLVDQIAPPDAVCHSPEMEAALGAIVERLVGNVPTDRYVYRLTILDDDRVNALAAPGGHIIVFRGLLEQARTPEEVAGVLAHEIQHVRLRHGTQAVLRELPIRLISVVVAGDIGALGQVAATLGSLRYRRADEEEADRGGMQMIRASRIAPDAMVRFFARVEETERRLPDLPTYLSTHPSNRARIDTLERMAANAAYAPVPLLEEYDWEARTVVCRAGP